MKKYLYVQRNCEWTKCHRKFNWEMHVYCVLASKDFIFMMKIKTTTTITAAGSNKNNNISNNTRNWTWNHSMCVKASIFISVGFVGHLCIVSKFCDMTRRKSKNALYPLQPSHAHTYTQSNKRTRTHLQIERHCKTDREKLLI